MTGRRRLALVVLVALQLVACRGRALEHVRVEVTWDRDPDVVGYVVKITQDGDTRPDAWQSLQYLPMSTRDEQPVLGLMVPIGGVYRVEVRGKNAAGLGPPSVMRVLGKRPKGEIVMVSVS